jgi:hypothetical protein
MFTKGLIIKVVVLLVLTLLFLSVAFGALVLADEGGGIQPTPPTKSPSPSGGNYSLVISLLTILQSIL